MIYLRTVWLHLKKDLQLEWRSREAVAGMLFFTLLIDVSCFIFTRPEISHRATFPSTPDE